MAFYGNDPRPGDNILALLEPGEFVVNRNAARKHKDELEYINDESAPRYEDGMQMGGDVRGSLLGEYLGLAENIPQVSGFWEGDKKEPIDKYRKAEIDNFAKQFLRDKGLRMQSGGSTLTQGSSTTALPLLSDIYKQMGIQPVEEQMGQFQEYDASREDVLFGDYSRQVAAERAAGQQGMSAAFEASLGMGKGFSGFGGRAQGMGQARKSLLQDFLSQRAGAQSSLFKQVRSERERYMTDIAGQMRNLQSEGGTEDYGTGTTDATYTSPTSTTGQTAPEGWPSANAYEQWRQSGSNPNTATSYGYQAPAGSTSGTPGYKSGNSQSTTTPSQTTTVPTTTDTTSSSMYDDPYQSKQ